MFNAGDKVRCINKTTSLGHKGNYEYVEIGQVYTVANNVHGKFTMMLKEVNALHPEGPYYVTDDFELVTTKDTDAAWERAFKGI